MQNFFVTVILAKFEWLKFQKHVHVVFKGHIKNVIFSRLIKS